MKDENPFLQVRGRLLLPLSIALAKKVLLVEVRMRSQKTGFGCKQINALWQPKLIIKSRRDVRVRKPVWTVTQYRRRFDFRPEAQTKQKLREAGMTIWLRVVE